MSNAELLHDNLLIGAGVTLGGGTWSLPVTNLLTRAMVAQPARCTAIATPGAATVTIDFGEDVSISRWAVFHITASLGGSTYRLRASSTSGHAGDLLDTGFQPIFRGTSPSMSLPWEHPGWWYGLPREKDVTGYPRHLVIAIPATKARWWSVEFSDPTNPAGYLDLGYMIAGTPISFEHNFDLGRRRGRTSRSIIEMTPGGGQIIDRRRAVRSHSMTWSMLSVAEASTIYDLAQNRDGVDLVLFIPDPDLLDAASIRDVFPARLVGSIGEMSRTGDGLWTVSVTLEELIA
ncbi:hypothetical protein [Zavarzinia compransoris]|uniref:Uncharacterized protein n=1 Tax=Zavarzinia compransoris TaxID=1264899 RepID=A0A317E8X1_9PROT|nr:hypothetical protein [Zavarzinia compransoris]PWR23349.1 hypothetical protein DKG75_01925 [Zavarzinia compransoris]TDP46077.1 hypothetical protein DES42_104160 [Zavarzinia compransoris]